MKKLTLLSIVTASLLIVGCGQGNSGESAKVAEPAKAEAPAHSETVAQKATKAVETASAAVEKTAKEATKTVAEKATKAVEATKKVATETAEKATTAAKEATKTVAEKATKAVEATKEAVSSAKATVAAPAAYTKCAGCHGKDGKMKALGKSEVIAGQAKADLVKKIGEYKAGTRNVAGMGALMKGQVAGLSDADVDAIATYVSGLK